MTRHCWSPLLALLAACGGPGPADDGAGPSGNPDADGDGYTTYSDCDDTDPGVHPGAPELCDGVDQDCDGEVDENPVDEPTWYPDGDGDGYGLDEKTVESCEGPEGHVLVAGDCDDADPTVNPGAREVCNGIDDDCSGLVDDDAPDVDTWYMDWDQDGYGDEAVVACDKPNPSSAVGGDCDDDDETVYPDADETCNGVDDDCDGEVDEEAVDGARIYADADGDGWGDDADAYWGCQPGIAEVYVGGDCDDGDAAAHPLADEDCDDPVDLNCDGSSGDEDRDGDGVVACEDCDDGDAGTGSGATWYEDADADAYGVDTSTRTSCSEPGGWAADGGDCDDEDAEVNPGATEISGDGVDNDCDGERNGIWGEMGMDEYGCTLTGDDRGDYAGGAVSSAGDWNGDEVPDLLIGARRSSVSGSYEGAAYVVLGGCSGSSTLLASATAVLRGYSSGIDAGRRVANAGDIDEDGYDDVVVGAPLESSYLEIAGAAFVVHGGITGTLSLADADATWFGEEGGSYASLGLAAGGEDLTGDGAIDIVIGASIYPDAERQGAAYVVSGTLTGTHYLGDDDSAAVRSHRKVVRPSDAPRLARHAMYQLKRAYSLNWIEQPGS